MARRLWPLCLLLGACYDYDALTRGGDDVSANDASFDLVVAELPATFDQASSLPEAGSDFSDLALFDGATDAKSTLDIPPPPPDLAPGNDGTMMLAGDGPPPPDQLATTDLLHPSDAPSAPDLTRPSPDLLVLPALCKDGLKDGNETDVDCGGSCPHCALGKSCLVHGDCWGTCANNKCVPGTGLALSFAAATNYPVTVDPGCIVAADFNGDGKTDLAHGAFAPGSLTVFLGRGDGSFGPSSSYPAQAGIADEFSADDLDKDGKADVALSTSSAMDVFLGTGNGSFDPEVPYALPGSGGDSTAGDVNGDGKADLFVAGDNGYLDVFWGRGNGTFPAAATLYIVNINSPRIADFNGDGKPDLAGIGSGITVLLGDGAGGFNLPITTPLSSNSYSTAMGDFNGDGKLDVLVVHQASGFMGSDYPGILLGLGDGHFKPETRFPGHANGLSVTVADFNLDGKLDFAQTCYDARSLDVFLGKGDGTFQSPNSIPVPGSPRSLVAADFNGDGRSDLATTTRGTTGVSVILNTSQ